MNLINVENISKSYSEKELLKNINLGINEGDKIGIIGINGTGKSTLLKIIYGSEQVDEGRIVKGNSVRIEYLPQNPDFNDNATVLQQVFKGTSGIMELIRNYEAALQNEATSSERLMELTHEMDLQNAWNLESEAKTVLTKLGILDFNQIIGTMSGGQKKRVALASALINPSDLLILDEPTNHLDNTTIDWLEEYLNRRKGALLMITHDRYFLDRVVNRIIEVSRGSMFEYQGNYTSFLEKKLEREEIEIATESKKKSLLKKELAWVKKGAKARTTKQKARIDRFEKLKDEINDIRDEKLEVSVAGSRLGKKVVILENIYKAFDEKAVIKDFSYIIQRDDRVGIIGPNGIGKSTLINLIAGKLKVDKGVIEIGETVKIGLFSQENYYMEEELRVIEYIREGAEMITTSDGYRISASQMLERFLFPSGLQWTPISKLSGGEKRRLYLLRVLMEAPNVLLLDEPTNDLDIETLTILEDYLDEFSGAVITVSHDRYFLDRVVDKIFLFEKSGTISQYAGNYSDNKDRIDSKEKEASNTIINKISSEPNVIRKKDKPLKFSYMEQREYDEIDNVISELEEKISSLEKEIIEASTNYEKLQLLLEEKKEIEGLLAEKMDRWVYLNELAEKISMEKSK